MISIIIPTYKDWTRLQLCLNALAKQSYPTAEFEIIIINNDSSESLPRSFTLPSNAVVINEPIPGSYAARNKALLAVKGKVIGFTDSDCLPEPDWISNAVSIMESDQKIDRLAGAVEIFREEDGSWLAWKFESIVAFNQKHNVKNGVSVTANLFVNRLVFDQVGLFDATLFSGGDIQWNRLASQQGVTLVYSDSVVVNHPARASMGEIVSKFRRVFGGELVRASREKRLPQFVLGLMAPPVRYARVLINDGKSISNVLFACLVYWGIKLLMLFEIIRLSLGGKPVRQ